jgi:hypothetical protein
MKNFIEVTCDSKKILININQISSVTFYESGKNAGCYVAFQTMNNGSSSIYKVLETYEEVKQLIESAI